MKTLLLICSLGFFASTAFSQAFHFDDTTTTLIKTTAQSPAHWYIEIFNDVGVDTTMRWKASFSNIPPQWEVQLDDQDNLTTNIQDGDSADFTLFAGLPLTQKLIIGVTLNDTPGAGSVYFDVYDPAAPEFVQRIQFRFIVTGVGIEELNHQKIIIQQGETIVFADDLIGSKVQIALSNGQIVYSALVEKEMQFPNISSGELFFVLAEKEGKLISHKFIAH